MNGNPARSILIGCDDARNRAESHEGQEPVSRTEPVAGPSVKKKPKTARERRVSAVRRVRRADVGAMTAQNVFHLIFEVELDLFQPDFFDLFGLRQIGAIGEVVDLFVEGVMTIG